MVGVETNMDIEVVCHDLRLYLENWGDEDEECEIKVRSTNKQTQAHAYSFSVRIQYTRQAHERGGEYVCE